MPVVKPPEPARPPIVPPAPEEAKDEDRASAPEPEKRPLPPDLQAAFEASWERHESAYRYLGR